MRGARWFVRSEISNSFYKEKSNFREQILRQLASFVEASFLLTVGFFQNAGGKPFLKKKTPFSFQYY
ncbi:hypothetical protein [Bacillus sp. PSXD-155]|uniref:hypothetical protein n=1 Tax=Bacillus sp. PSXD-155 TaxID=3404821 RepID=UPI003BB79E9A